MDTKILNLTAYFFPENSGTTTRLYNLLRRQPWNISLITSNSKMNGELIFENKEQIENITIFRKNIFSYKKWLNIFVLKHAYIFYNYYYGHNTLLNKSELDQWRIVHVHNVLPFGEVGRKISKQSNCRFVFELHGIPEESLNIILKPTLGYYFQKENHKLMNSADRILTLTQSLKDYICTVYDIPSNKVTVVPNGADIEIFSNRGEYKRKAKTLKTKLGIKDKVVMYAGSVDYINGIDDLIKIIPLIITEFPNITFVFIGNGPEVEKIISLSKMFPDNIVHLKQVPYKEMPVYYQLSDIFVIPRPSTVSSETITPLKLLEVMAMGKTVIGSNVGGISEIIKDGYNGYLYEKENMISFKEILFKVLNTDNSIIEENARATIVENYSWDKSSIILQKVYEELLCMHINNNGSPQH